jgi:hypothetical protein
LFLVLPEASNCLGAGYPRFVIQAVCTTGQMGHDDRDQSKMCPWRVPFAHILDDSISEFFRLRKLTHLEFREANALNTGCCTVQTMRQSVTESFRQALMSLQQDNLLRSYWVQGFSRDDGLCCTKIAEETFGGSVYKAVLLNFEALHRADVF